MESSKHEFSSQEPEFLSEEYFVTDSEPRNSSFSEIVFFSLRVASLCLLVSSLLCISCLLSLHSSTRKTLKSWPLTLLASLILFSWLSLTLYQDHIDEMYVHHLTPSSPTHSKKTIFWVFRNLLYGLSLYSIILLLSHLSDFQRRSSWFLIVFSLILFPLSYSLFVLFVDLYASDRTEWYWSLSISTVRIALYNVISNIFLLLYSVRFCTTRLYGTYEERRSPFVVWTSRWIFINLFLHNLTAISSYGIQVAILIKHFDVDLTLFVIIHDALEEASYLFAVSAIPVSIVFCILARLCCSSFSDDDHLEMEKIDKIYQEVWTMDVDKSKSNPSSSSQTYYSSSDDRILSTPSGINFRNKSSTLESRKKRESYLEAVSMGSLHDEKDVSMTSSNPIEL